MEEKIEKGQQIGQLPKRDVLTGNEQFPFQEDRENGSCLLYTSDAADE